MRADSLAELVKLCERARESGPKSLPTSINQPDAS
jgi:hypothetical protein